MAASPLSAGRRWCSSPRAWLSMSESRRTTAEGEGFEPSSRLRDQPFRDLPVVRRFGPAHVAPPASLADPEWSFHREAGVEARAEAVPEQVGAEGRAVPARPRGAAARLVRDGALSWSCFAAATSHADR